MNVPSYPVLDGFGAPLLVGLFVILLVGERCWPLRTRVDRGLRRILANLLVAGPTFLVLRLLLIPAVVAVASWAEARHFGLLRLVEVPEAGAIIAAVVLLDYTMYHWHWLNHRVPFLWRFHHVHHTDLDLDVFTGFRFHFGEMLLSVGVRAIQVVLVGASPAAALIYEIVLEASTEFHHSNLRLSAKWERVLNRFIVSPRAHGIHHSVVTRETNSNFSNFLLVWDRLHRTVRLDVPQETIVVGVPEYPNPAEVHGVALLLMPFRRQRQRTVQERPGPPH